MQTNGIYWSGPLQHKHHQKFKYSVHSVSLYISYYCRSGSFNARILITSIKFSCDYQELVIIDSGRNILMVSSRSNNKNVVAFKIFISTVILFVYFCWVHVIIISMLHKHAALLFAGRQWHKKYWYRTETQDNAWLISNNTRDCVVSSEPCFSCCFSSPSSQCSNIDACKIEDSVVLRCCKYSTLSLLLWKMHMHRQYFISYPQN